MHLTLKDSSHLFNRTFNIHKEVAFQIVTRGMPTLTRAIFFKCYHCNNGAKSCPLLGARGA